MGDSQLQEVQKAMSALLSPQGLPLIADMEIDVFTPQSCRTRRTEAIVPNNGCGARRGMTPRSCFASPRSTRSATRSTRRECAMDVVEEWTDGGSMAHIVCSDPSWEYAQEGLPV